MITLPAPWTVPGEATGPSWPSFAPDVVDDLDPGLAGVRSVHDTLGLDVPWSLHQGRGFARRIDGLVQRVWSEAVRPSSDGPAYLVHAEIEVVRDITDTAAALGTANALNGLCSLGAFVVDPRRGTITHRTGAWVRGGSFARVAQRFGIAVGLQASEAAELDRVEIASWSPADPMGSWVAVGDRMQHVAFYPNLAHTGPADATELLRSGALRARWVAEVLS